MAHGSARADPRQPYQVQIVLRVAEHPLLTRVFKTQLARELRDYLQADLGKMARVDMVESHPLLKEIEATSLQHALDAWQEVTDRKTYFVLVDFRDGQYEVRLRQHDGYTGLCTSVPRHIRTADRQFVGRLTALLMDQDFGPVGVVKAISYADGAKPPDEMTVELMGGAELNRWVTPQRVFALAAVNQRSGKRYGDKADSVFLQVRTAPRADGKCVCRLVYRLAQPLAAGPGVQEYRCVLLTTVTHGALNLRVVNFTTRQPLSNLGLRLNQNGSTSVWKERGATNEEGFKKTQHTYDHLAFVDVFNGDLPSARIPVPIMDQEQTVVCAVRVDKSASEPRISHEIQRRHWYDGLRDCLLVQAELVREISGMRTKEALAKAKKNLADLQADLKNLESERAQLKSSGLDLSDGELGLRRLAARKDAWDKFIKDSEEILAAEPKRQALLAALQQAKLYEEDLEYDRAIQLYEKALADAAALEAIRKEIGEKLTKLKAAWKPKSEQHQQARKFIYDTWMKLQTPAEMKAKLPDARQMFAVCKSAGDKMTPNVLLKTYVMHSARLTKRYESLRPDSKEDQKEEQLIAEVRTRLAKFQKEVADYLTKN